MLEFWGRDQLVEQLSRSGVVATISMDEEDWALAPANGSSAFYIESWMDPTESSIKSLWAWHDPEEVPLQIAITGTAGTGKKKLAHALSKTLELPVIYGVARNVQSIGFKLNDKSRWADEFTLFLGQFYEQCEYSEFIAAGTLIDLIAHCHYFVEHYGSKKDRFLLRALANVINTVANNDYSIIFYLPYTTKPRGDGVRATDIEYLKEIDKLIHYYLDAFDIDYLPIKGNAKEKYDIAYSYLEDFGLLFNRG